MRIGIDALRQKRESRTSRFLVTGGTGFLGSHIAFALLRAGYPVTILARSSKKLPARDRIARLADWFGLEKEARSWLNVVEGDFLDPGWSIASLAEAAGPVDEIVHCASNTAFTERKRAEVEAVNIIGLQNVLNFAAQSGCYFFHHISTAYVAGLKTGVCREEWVEPKTFTNVYEETKSRGEALTRDVCRREGLRLNVYRPSIVYGDSRTGRTLRFNALYFPVKAAVLLRDVYLADIREHGGRKAVEMGIRVKDNGDLLMPIRIEVGREGGLNLLPVDYCVDVFLAILEDGLDGGIYHLVNSRPTRIEDIVEYAMRLFHLDGVRTCGPEAFAAQSKNALEALYDTYLDAYRPYMQDLRTFEIKNAAPILERHGLVCPAFDYDIFARCMNYAVETRWGARLFP